MSESKLQQSVREELGLVGIKNKTPRRVGGERWVHRHQFDPETGARTSGTPYVNSKRQKVKLERAERRAKCKAYAKQYLRSK